MPPPKPGAISERLVEEPDDRNDYGEQDDHHDETQQRVAPDLPLFRAVHLVPIRLRPDLQEMPPTFAFLSAVPHGKKRTHIGCTQAVHMPREDAAAKARRLLAEGRVTVRTITTDQIVAEVRGDSARAYSTRWDPGGWHCDCDALSRCSHVRAVQLITLEPKETRP